MSEDKLDIVGSSNLQGKNEPAGASPASGENPNPGSPVTATEITLHAIWSSALAQTTFSREDNFIVLGGDSLSLAQVITEVEETFHVQLPVEVVTKSLTLKGMAEAIDLLLANTKKEAET